MNKLTTKHSHTKEERRKKKIAALLRYRMLDQFKDKWFPEYEISRYLGTDLQETKFLCADSKKFGLMDCKQGREYGKRVMLWKLLID